MISTFPLLVTQLVTIISPIAFSTAPCPSWNLIPVANGAQARRWCSWLGLAWKQYTNSSEYFIAFWRIFIGGIFESTATRESDVPSNLGIFFGREHFIDDFRDVLSGTSTFDSVPIYWTSPFPFSSSRPFQRTIGSSDPLQDLYTLQQHTRTIRYGDTDNRNFKNQRSRTFLLCHVWTMGVVPAHGWLLAPLLWSAHAPWNQPLRGRSSARVGFAAHHPFPKGVRCVRNGGEP